MLRLVIRPSGSMEDFLTGFICADDPDNVYVARVGWLSWPTDRSWWPTTPRT